MCVNVFVLISGWFGIRASARGAMSFVFQCLYFGRRLYFVGCIVSGVLPNVLGIAQVLTLFKVNWFITAYLILYSFAPVLNGFAGNVGRRQLAIGRFLFLDLRCVDGLFRGFVRFVPYVWKAKYGL